MVELLPANAEIDMCLTCREFTTSDPYPFEQTTGLFPDVASFYMNQSVGQVSGGGFRVAPEAADNLQARIDQAAQRD